MKYLNENSHDVIAVFFLHCMLLYVAKIEKERARLVGKYILLIDGCFEIILLPVIRWSSGHTVWRLSCIRYAGATGHATLKRYVISRRLSVS